MFAGGSIAASQNQPRVLLGAFRAGGRDADVPDGLVTTGSACDGGYSRDLHQMTTDFRN
jgi:hypothetical protein